MQETADLLRRAEEQRVQKGLAQVKTLRTRYEHAAQRGETVLAKKLRREYYQELFITLTLTASPMELLFPDTKLEALMDNITQELGW
jgi:hypothetical protein